MKESLDAGLGMKETNSCGQVAPKGSSALLSPMNLAHLPVPTHQRQLDHSLVQLPSQAPAFPQDVLRASEKHSPRGSDECGWHCEWHCLSGPHTHTEWPHLVPRAHYCNCQGILLSATQMKVTGLGNEDTYVSQHWLQPAWAYVGFPT